MEYKVDKRKKVYFKIFNQEEKHHDLQYQDGLVKDFIPFNSNKKKSCGAGGIYFSDAKNILKFAGYGPWIRQVEIPKDAKHLKDPEGDKYRADKLFLYPRKPLFNVETIKWLVENNVDLDVDNYVFIRRILASKMANIIEFLVNNIEDIKTNRRAIIIFQWAIRHNLNILKLIIKKGYDINYDDSWAIRFTTMYWERNFEMIKLLVANGVKINAEHGEPLSNSIHNNELKIVKLLVENGADISLVKPSVIEKSKKKIKKYLNSWNEFSDKEKTLIYLNNILEQREAINNGQ